MLLKLKLVQIYRPRLCVSWDPAQILLVNEVINYGAVSSLSLSGAGRGKPSLPVGSWLGGSKPVPPRLD